VDDDNPWPGLDSYQEKDQRFFKGREPQIEELSRMVRRDRVTVLFGVSGLGKTSLLRAGLFPLLRAEDELPVYVRLAFGNDAPTPHAQVLAAVARSAAVEQAETPSDQDAQSLWEFFHRRSTDFWSPRNRLLIPVLVFDQFEEVFSLGRGLDSTPPFLQELSDLVEGRPPASLKARLEADPQEARLYDFSNHRYRVILSLREDFLSELEGLRDRMPSCINNRMWLRPMDGEAAFRVVDQTKGRLIPSVVAEQVVRVVAGKDPELDRTPRDALQIEPAILSLFCRELNERRGEKPQITSELVVGSQGEILHRFYERCMAQVSGALRIYVENELLTQDGFRDSRSYGDAQRQTGVSDEELRRLIDLRLLRVDERAGTRRLELAHDVLTKVARGSRDRRREVEEADLEKRRLEEELRAGQERERQARLEAEVLAANEKEQRLRVEASNGRRLAAALALLMVAALALAWSFYAQSERDLAQQRALIASSNSKRNAELAETARQSERNAIEAAANAENANRRLQRIVDGINLKKAVLSGDDTELKRYLASGLANHSIAFGANAKPRGYKTGDGRAVYQFSLFPVAASVEGGLESIAAITFRMDEPSFTNRLLTTGVEKRFTAYYEGWGCLHRVLALIEYVDPDRSPEIAQFDMCDVIPAGVWKEKQ